MSSRVLFINKLKPYRYKKNQFYLRTEFYYCATREEFEFEDSNIDIIEDMEGEKEKSFQKRDDLIKWEKEVADEWSKERIYEIDAPPPGDNTPKYTFKKKTLMMNKCLEF